MKCIHHNDMDGRSAGAVIAYFTGDYNKEDYFEMDYSMQLPIDKIGENEIVYIVDFSFTDKTKGSLAELMKVTKNIFWIDHHASSMRMREENPEFASIQGIVEEGISGAALTYMFCANGGEKMDLKEVPLFLQYVSDFDCWLFTLPKTMEFKYGVECEDYAVLSDLWVNLFREKDVVGLDIGLIPESTVLSKILNQGTYAKKYNDRELQKYCNDWSYEAEVDGHKALVINRRSNSAIFGERIKDYDLCSIWVFDGEKYSYSLYSDKKDIDVSKIAEKFGGGGHPGAAGFISQDRVF